MWRMIGLLMVWMLGAAVILAEQTSPAPAGAAESKSDAGAPVLTLKVTTREVVIDVVATDRHNHPLNDLQKTDFQVFEVAGNGTKVPQTVTAFRLIEPATGTQDTGVAAGLRVTLGGSCAERSTVHYEVAYQVSLDRLTSGHHDIFVTTSRRDTRLAFGRGYFVGTTEVPATPPVLSPQQEDAALLEAACYHSATPLSIPLTARFSQSGDSEMLRYFITVRSDSLALISLSNQARNLNLDYGVCTFNADGKALRFLRFSANRILTSGEYVQASEYGFPGRVEFSPLGKPAFARFVVRDLQTGNMGSVDAMIADPAPEALTSDEAEAAARWKEQAKRGIKADLVDYPPLGPIGSFGSALPRQNSFCGDVYELPEGTAHLPNFWNLSSVGSVHAYTLDVPHQQFWKTGGIPGVTRRTDWFGIDYYGAFRVATRGEYEFRLVSDDGARLYIDDDLVVDQDALHNIADQTGKVMLEAGSHAIHLPYFQGPPISVALQLFVKRPGGTFEPFDLRSFEQPDSLTAPGGPVSTKRR